MKYAFISQQPTKRVSRWCQVLGVSRSGYYAWLRRPEPPRTQEDRLLLERIEDVHHRSRQAYGTRRVWKQLATEGVDCGRERVARLRRQHGILTRRRRRFRMTTHSRHQRWIAPNLVQRQFHVEMPDRVWVGDVTFIATREGWLYLAVMLDLYSRKIVGWSMSNRNDVSLVRDALQMAIMQRCPAPGLVHHTDRGRLYAADEYRALLDRHAMVPSMSRKKDCWDNAVAESFFATLKHELTWGKSFRTRDQARQEIFEYIEVFYNRIRLHQTLGYRSPVAFESMTAVA